MKSKLSVLGIKIVIFLLWICPFFLLYILADLTAIVLRKVVKYRRKTVQKNLINSFPEKNKEEIKKIEKEFYRHLADILLEGIKGMWMSKESLKKHFRFLNPELLDKDFNEGQNIFVMPAHYGNWEWAVLSFSLHVKQEVIGVYKPLKNRAIENYIASRRSRYGLILNSLYDTREAMLNPPAKPSLYIMMSDQSPSNTKKAHWMDFLHQDTACLHGADVWSRRLEYPVYYMHINRVKRGYYDVTFELLEAKPQQTEAETITKKYMHQLENYIKEKPSDWLWSHDRWKKKRSNQSSESISKT